MLIGLDRQQEVATDLEAKPAGRHAGRDLEEVGDDALVQPAQPLLRDDDPDGIGDGLILVAHAGHGVDLEAPPEHVAGGGVRTEVYRMGS